jgi:cytochrome b subunit of formate dehydrogenase/mono/diheme cytochrome c family protein
MATKPTVKKEAPRTYVRFALAQRVEHVFMLLSFATLGFTGLPQKYASHPAAVAFVNFLGGIENLRAIHHLAAAVMMLGTIYHILIVGYKIFVERRRMTMLPVFQDAKDALGAFVYNLGFRKSRPQMGRYTFEEKAEYWAFVWGAVVMGFTGFLMWNPVTTAKFLPGEFIPAAKAAHGGEALLAVLAIIVWHMYGVHIKSFNKAMWTGRMTEDEMLHEHPLELADIKAGVADRPVNAVTLRKRQMFYFPVAAILTVVMLAGVYGFTAAENTALTTIPPQPQAIQVFVPQTPTTIPSPMPSLTPMPRLSTITPAASSAAPTWNSVIGALFAGKCTSCHGGAQPSAGGLDLSSYTNAIQGGVNGPWFIGGDSANSLLVTKFISGDHPYAALLEEELALIKEWIDAGALEQ